MAVRYTDTILSNKTAYARGTTAPMVDLKYGGQFGWQTDYSTHISSAPYVRRNVMARVIQPPLGFLDYGGESAKKMIETFKALIELHSKTIEGLNSTLTPEYRDSAFGGAGEMIDVITNVTRARSEVTHGLDEKYGMPVTRFVEAWIQDFLMDPETKAPRIITYSKDRRPKDLLPDYTGATVLYFEPDPTFTYVNSSWLVTNMMPKNSPDRTGSKDATQGGDTKAISLQFTGLQQVGYGVDMFAQKLLDSLNLVTGGNPNLRPAFVDSISPDLDTAKYGFNELVNSVKPLTL